MLTLMVILLEPRVHLSIHCPHMYLGLVGVANNQALTGKVPTDMQPLDCASHNICASNTL
jgi:hypothetical protein